MNLHLLVLSNAVAFWAGFSLCAWMCKAKRHDGEMVLEVHEEQEPQTPTPTPAENGAITWAHAHGERVPKNFKEV